MSRVRRFQTADGQRIARCFALSAVVAALLWRGVSIAFAGVSRSNGGGWPMAPVGVSHSRISRNFFFEEDKPVRGAPPPPVERVIPEEADEKQPEGNTRFPAMPYTILPYPAPELRRPNADVTKFNDALLKEFIITMLKMLKTGGTYGLCAPQFGTNLNLMVMNVDGAELLNTDPFKPDKRYGNMVFINPVVTKHSSIFEEDYESGVSCVDVSGVVPRSKWVEIEYQDFKGLKFAKKLDGFAARVFQHNYDHLQGVLFIDRMQPDELKTQKKYMDVLMNAYIDRTKVFYESMGLEYGAPPDEVKRSYKKAMVQYHPDKNPTEAELAKFKDIKASYDVLRRKLGLRA